MFRSKEVHKLKEQANSLKARLEMGTGDQERLCKEYKERLDALTSPLGGYWLFSDLKMGVGASTFVKLFASISNAKAFLENAKSGPYRVWQPVTWAQIANLIDGRLIVLEELVAMPTRPWRRVWISVRD